ncbi:BON domain-containing protein [Granulicella tundricola]|uniref:Transport-associated protein n=1 Tax=Granulicella tundricola (strain ATCC BAA-1859 / DSM 23138 / MP5ACTX9) TaxID=1198114 RepID=E8X2A9_GRATM|nr:BON domain-containing protein [Granulicella tundricola]ADW68041.1 transport-associated protein [Granulicella tundricola MP5ACTX9]
MSNLTCRTLVLATALAAGLSGCKSKPTASAPDDAALSSAINAQLIADTAINNQPIQGSVQDGVATLTGSVANDAQKTIASRDASSIQGVRSVVNNLQVGAPYAGQPAAPAPTATVVAPPPPPPARLAESRKPTAMVPQLKPQPRQSAPVQRDFPQDVPMPPVASNQPAPVFTAPPPPPPPPRPTFRDVTVPSATTLPVRITQTLDSATTQAGETFSGTLAADVMIEDQVVLPAGTAVSGRVDAVQEAAHFKGNSLLTVSLTSVRPRGASLPVTSEPYSVEGKGRGKNTAEKTGGGAAVGAILGGIFGGGKGAAIGAVTGGGLGAGSNAITKGQQVQIPSETVVRFHTDSPITVHVRVGGPRGNEDVDPSLQHRPSN